MKKKIILILIILIVILFFSYPNFYKKEINYTLLGDRQVFSNNIISKNFSDLIYDELKKEEKINYNKDFIENDIRIIDIIDDINDNKKINDISIQKLLKNSNILILNIGNNELYYKLSKYDNNENYDKEIYIYLDSVLKDYEILLNQIKKYNIEKVFIIGAFNDTNNINNDKFYRYINNQINNYAKNNNMIFIDEITKNNEYITKTTPIYITNKGNLTLFNKIYSKISNFYLHKEL